MKKIILALLALCTTATTLSAATPTSWQTISTRYESIRLSLVKDSFTAVASDAKAIDVELAKAEKKLDAATFGVTDSAKAKKLIPQLRSAAQSLAASKSVSEARERFALLSTKLIELRTIASASRGVVAYCSMAKKSWLQPSREIGNPYYGSSMARCGEIVADR